MPKPWIGMDKNLNAFFRQATAKSDLAIDKDNLEKLKPEMKPAINGQQIAGLERSRCLT